MHLKHLRWEMSLLRVKQRESSFCQRKIALMELIDKEDFIQGYCNSRKELNSTPLKQKVEDVKLWGDLMKEVPGGL